MITQDDLRALIRQDYRHAVSITMPTHIAGQEIMQDPVRLGNLLDKADDELVARGLRRDDVKRRITDWARALVPDKEFWRYQEGGLALFMAPDEFVLHKVQVPLPETLTVGRRFNILPLLPAVAPDDAFFVITVSHRRVGLFRGGPSGLEEIDTSDLPTFQDVYDESEYTQDVDANPMSRSRRARTMRFQPDSSNIPQAHNAGNTAEQTRYAEFIEFLRRTATGVEEKLSGANDPIVLAALPDTQGEFRKFTHLDALLDEGVTENPDDMPRPDLHRKACDIVSARGRDIRNRAVEKTVAAVNDGKDRRGTLAHDEIVKGAHWGRVDTLIVAEGAHLWGCYDEDADTLEARAEPGQGDEDLLNFAALETLRHGGQVKMVPAGLLPSGAAAAALMRWDER